VTLPTGRLTDADGCQPQRPGQRERYPSPADTPIRSHQQNAVQAASTATWHAETLLLDDSGAAALPPVTAACADRKQRWRMGAGAAGACVPKGVSRASRVWGAFSTSQTHSRLSAPTSHKHLAWLAQQINEFDAHDARLSCAAPARSSNRDPPAQRRGATKASRPGAHLPARPTSFGSPTGDGREGAVSRPLVAAARCGRAEIGRRAAVLALSSGAHRATALGGCRLPAGPRPQTIGTLPGPGRPFYPERWLRQAGTDCSVDFVVRRRRLRTWRLVCCRARWIVTCEVGQCFRGAACRCLLGRGADRRAPLARVSVFDPGQSGGITKTASRPLHLGGMGLKVVEKLASRWGAGRRAQGFEVCADLELRA
jgi:hypothetical protein